MELYQQTAASLSHMLRKKECSAVEIMKSVQSRIDAVETEVSAYLTILKEEALFAAGEADRHLARGEGTALTGIPIGIKDNICTKGIPTTCASKILENFTPPYHAEVMERIHREHMVVTGKLNMDEFAMGSSSETSYYKTTRNPHNLNCVPGGSSGGSAAAVSAGETIVSLGSDTGGSIRQPAACCGVIGLKPTYGSVSRYGLIAFASSLDQIGPIGRSIEDIAMLCDVIMGYDNKDATSVNRTYASFREHLCSDIHGMKIGLPKEFFGAGIADEVKTAVYRAAKELEQAGAVISEMSLPGTDYALSAYYIVSSAEASSNLARYDGIKYGYRSEKGETLIDLYERTRSEGFGKEVKRRILLGTFVLSSGYCDAYYKRAKLAQKKITEEYNEAFKTYDAILTPVMPTTAFQIGEKLQDPLQMYAADVCTVPVNMAGLPALVQPCGKDRTGLPIGMQLIGARFGEQKLLHIGKAFEELSGGVFVQDPVK